MRGLTEGVLGSGLKGPSVHIDQRFADPRFNPGRHPQVYSIDLSQLAASNRVWTLRNLDTPYPLVVKLRRVILLKCIRSKRTSMPFATRI